VVRRYADDGITDDWTIVGTRGIVLSQFD